MSFRRLARRTIRWRPVEGDGLEHLTIGPEEGEIVARGVIVGARGGSAYGVDYTIVCGPDWAVRALDLGTSDGMAISLRSDGLGRWTRHDGKALPEFDGCLDVDLAGSAFTNTLPIRRLWPDLGQRAAHLAMLYVPFTTFVPVRDAQVYTGLEGGRRFRYEAEDRSFAADLPVDEDGLVLDYPTLFARVREF